MGSAAVSTATKMLPFAALVLFSVLALGYRWNHPPGSVAYQFDSTSGSAFTYEFATEKTVANGQTTETILRDKDGTPKPKLYAAAKTLPLQKPHPNKSAK